MADEEEQQGLPEEENPNEESLGSGEGANEKEDLEANSAEGEAHEGEEEQEEEEVVILPPEIIPAGEPDCPECKSGAPAWMATFADMATLLMAFFVLILSFAHMNVPKFKNVSGSMKSTFGVQRSVPVVEPPTAQIINKEGPANILASKDSLLSLGDNLIILSMPQNSKKTKVEPIKIIPKITGLELDRKSVV